MTLSFHVPGCPQPGGSKKGFVNPKTGRVIITEDASRNREWRSLVVMAARQAHQGPPMEGPLHLVVNFHVTRPKGHYRTGKNASELRAGAPRFPTSKPDLTKLLRSTEDALTDAGVWRDDAQIVTQYVTKRYAPKAGANITVEEIDD